MDIFSSFDGYSNYILVAIVVLFISTMLYFVIKNMIAKPVVRLEIVPLLDKELPNRLEAPFNEVMAHLIQNGFHSIGDFKTQYIKGTDVYLRLFVNDETGTYGSISGISMAKNMFQVVISLSNDFENHKTVLSLNNRNPLLPYPETIIRQYPRCMPADLIRFHKEYIKTIASPSIPPLDVPSRMAKHFEENNVLLLEKGVLKKGKKEGNYTFGFGYILFAFFKHSLRAMVFQPPENTVVNKKYDDHFKDIVGSKLMKDVKGMPKSQTKSQIIVFVVMFFIFLLIFLVPPVISLVTDFVDNFKKGFDYSEASLEETITQPAFTFGKVAIKPFSVNVAQLEKSLGKYYRPAIDSLKPGLTQGEIDDLLNQLPLQSKESLISLYQWRNGQVSGEIFLPGMRFLPLLEAKYIYQKNSARMLTETKRQMLTWKQFYFPIMHNEEENYYLVVCCGGIHKGAVLRWNPVAWSGFLIAYPSVSALFQETVENFQGGGYYIDDEGNISVDRDKKGKITKKYHPKIYVSYPFADAEAKVEKMADGSRKETRPTGYERYKVVHYDKNNRLIYWETYANNRLALKVKYSYDEQNRITARDYFHKGNINKKVRWKYQENGKSTIFVWYLGGNGYRVEALSPTEGEWRVLKRKLI